VAAGMAVNVSKTFLDDAKKGEFNVAREATEAGSHCEVHEKTAASFEAVDVVTNGVRDSRFVEKRRMQKIGESANFTHGTVNERLALREKLTRLALGRRNGIAELIEYGSESGEVLTGRVVKFAGDSAALIILKAQELPAKAAEFAFGAFAFLFGAHAIGDVVSDSADDGDGNALGAQGVMELPDSEFAAFRKDRQNSFSGAMLLNCGQVVCKTLELIGRKEIAHRLAEEFGAGISEQLSGQFVDGEKAALQIVRADQIGGMLDKIAITVFALAQGGFDVLAGGDARMRVGPRG